MSNPITALRNLYSEYLLPIENRVKDQIPDGAKEFLQPVASVVNDVGTAALDAAEDIATRVDEKGALNVAGDLLNHHAEVTGQVANAAVNEIIQTATNTQDGKSFADWLLGPEGPKVSGYAAQVPGLQEASGNFMDASMGNPLVAGAIGKVFGFEYNPEGDFYTTNEGSMQSLAGFHAIYDKAGKFLGMDLDEKVIHLDDVDGVDYKFEIWKGSYGNGGAYGGEMGLYTRGAGDRGPLGDLLEKIPRYYSSANGESQIRMTQTIYDQSTGDILFTNDAKGADGDDGKHYWNLAIRTDPGVNHEDIGQRGTLEFDTKDKALAEAMYQKLVESRVDKNGDGVYDMKVEPLKQNADGTWVIDYDWTGEH